MMRLLTYNIHGCVGRGGLLDPAAILSVIDEADADVVALQEVHDDDAIDRSFLAALKERLDYDTILYGPTLRLPESHYGNLLLCRLPLIDHERLDLSRSGREPRGAIRVRLTHRGRDLEITATHLGLAPGERRAQIGRLTDDGRAAADVDADVPTREPIRVLMGDLNEWFPLGRANRRLHARFGRSRAVATFPARFPLFALDRIHVRPDTVSVDTRVLDGPVARRASDHLPLIADLAW